MFRRGFKAEAERIACEVRTELDLGPMDPLNPLVLTEHLAIPVVGMSALAELADNFLRGAVLAGGREGFLLRSDCVCRVPSLHRSQREASSPQAGKQPVSRGVSLFIGARPSPCPPVGRTAVLGP